MSRLSASAWVAALPWNQWQLSPGMGGRLAAESVATLLRNTHTMRSVGAIPLESVPILGISTIIVTTAWELRDTCRTLDDMADLQAYLGQDPDMSFAARACDMVAIHSARVDYYGGMPESECRAKAEVARDRVFELAEHARAEAPHLIDETGVFDVEIEQAAEDEFMAINEICDCIADLACDPSQLAQR